ncbi:hypothetical protein SM124_22300 [Bacillus sp. 31A1R]|uniref:SAF domain-containing protein n=1 Tax=Robertmurraya mangrovi TaxID=3098077 RepID=A0ABU5J4Z9_9BACI|nr:hypothetical protein [Bacillus sp. 31A1R]MDZ5474430.1 hypothetical protein [Bacillus sp. 31A1R]
MIDAKRKAIIFLTIAFLLAVAAAGVILVQIQEAQQKLGKTVLVAVAKEDIKSYHEIKETDYDWVELPENSAHDSFIKNEQDLRGVISVVELKKGDLITGSLIRRKLDIPTNERVVWINATEIVLIDQLVAEGDLVDIVAVYKDEKEKVQTERILSNIQVVQIDKGKEGKQRVKVALSIEDAERVIHEQNTAVQLRVLRVNQAGEIN